MNKRKKNYFNLIEIAMALGIIGFGVTAVMGVFPAALQNAENSISENYASNVADIFYAYINQELKSDPNSYYDGSGNKKSDEFKNKIESIIPEIDKPQEMTEESSYSLTDTKSAEDISDKSIYDKKSDDETNPVTKNIFTGASGVFKVIQGEDPNTPEFSAIVRVWRKVNNDSGIIVYNKTTGNYDSTNATEDFMTTVFVEVSWPAFKPYGRREKRLFVKEIYDIYD